MKITELDLKTEGKRYKCGNRMFVIKNGDLFDVEMYTYLKNACIPVAELIEMEFKEVNEMKNPYTRVDYREKYYNITGDGCITFIEESGHGYDTKMFNIANYFNNKEYAKYISFKETLMRKLDKFAWEHNEKVIDWDDDSSGKFYIIFNHDDNGLIIDWNCSHQSNNIYFTSREIAEKAIEEFKDNLIKLYTWKFNF